MEPSLITPEELPAESRRSLLDDDRTFLRAAVASMAEGMLVLGAPRGEILICNPAAERILALKRKALEGQTVATLGWNLIRPDGSPFPSDERPSEVTLRTGLAIRDVVIGITRPDGSRTWIRSSSEPLRRSPDAEPHAVVATFTDITELHELTQRHAAVAARLAESMAGANVGTWEHDVASGRTVRSPRFAEILGLQSDELAPTLAAWLDLIHPDDRAGVKAAVAAANTGGGAPYSYECRARHKDGAWIWVQSRGKIAEHDASGAATRLAGVFIDIDAPKRTEALLRTSLAENQRLVAELRGVLATLHNLEAIIPICMYCKSVRDDHGYWEKVEAYLHSRTGTQFSHGICEKCLETHHGE